MADEKKVKVEVICGSTGKNHKGEEEPKGLLNFNQTIYENGDVLEMTESEAKAAMVDRNVKLADAGAKLSTGREQRLDAVEAAVRAKRFEDVQGAIMAPPASQDPKKPIPAAHIPDHQVKPLGPVI